MVFDKSHLTTTVGYRCPGCGGTVLSGVGIFDLSGDLLKLKCPCGGSELTIAKEKENRILLDVPCLLCRTSHRFPLSKEVFGNRDGEPLRLQCQFSGVPVLYLGERQAVASAMEQDGEALLRILEDAGITPEQLLALPAEDPVDERERFDGMQEIVRFMLVELDEEGKIRCDCQYEGEIPLYDFEMLSGRARIFCQCCRRETTVPLGSVADAERFLKIDSLVLED